VPDTIDEFTSPNGCIAGIFCDDVFGMVFAEGLTVPEFDAYSAWQRRLIHPNRPVVSMAVSIVVQMLSYDVRQATENYIQEFGKFTKASATIIPAVGFSGAAARAMASTIYLVSRTSFPRKVFADIDSGEHWLALHLDDPSPLRTVADWLRERSHQHEIAQAQP